MTKYWKCTNNFSFSRIFFKKTISKFRNVFSELTCSKFYHDVHWWIWSDIFWWFSKKAFISLPLRPNNWLITCIIIFIIFMMIWYELFVYLKSMSFIWEEWISFWWAQVLLLHVVTGCRLEVPDRSLYYYLHCTRI